MDLVPGKKYRIKYKSGTQRVSRYAVMRYISCNQDSYFWDLRPVAGTQDMPRHWVESVELVPDDTRVYINGKK